MDMKTRKEEIRLNTWKYHQYQDFRVSWKAFWKPQKVKKLSLKKVIVSKNIYPHVWGWGMTILWGFFFNFYSQFPVDR